MPDTQKRTPFSYAAIHDRTMRPVVRPVRRSDIDALLAIEAAAFETDRMSRRSMTRMISRKTASFLVLTCDGEQLGYALILYRSGTALGRLYSIALDPSAFGRGFGAKLLEAAEEAAFKNGCIFLRLEVRADNKRAARLYQAQGYKQFGLYPDYYEDHTDAVRYEKRLTGSAPPPNHHPPYYRQTTDFTCGPACMIMGLKWFVERKNGTPKFDRRFELRLWREATTIFMISGVGGCEPYGMAVALEKYGVRSEIWTSHKSLFFLEGLKSKERRAVMQVVQSDFREEAEALDIPIEPRRLSRRLLENVLDNGGLAIVLITGYEMYRDDEPHWILVHGHDAHHVYVHDPWIEDGDLETTVAAASLPIPWSVYERMIRVGRARRSAAVVMYGKVNR